MGALIGLVIGSFLNVVVVRLPKDQSLVFPKSACPSCKHSIPFWANIPLLGYLLLGGRCFHCKQAISFRYPLIEFLCALLFFTTQYRFGMSSELILRDWPFVSLLIAITFIDLEHRIIPDRLSLGGLALGALTCFRATEPGWFSCLLGAGFGFGIFFLLSWVYYRWKGVVGLGGG